MVLLVRTNFYRLFLLRRAPACLKRGGYDMHLVLFVKSLLFLEALDGIRCHDYRTKTLRVFGTVCYQGALVRRRSNDWKVWN